MDIFGEKLLQIKKAVFLSAVENAALALGVKPPKVKFWEGICPTDNGYSIAHIHLDTKTICIARRYLVALNFDELKEAVEVCQKGRFDLALQIRDLRHNGNLRGNSNLTDNK